MPVIVALFGGILFAGAGIAVLADFGGTGTRMAERGPGWTRMGSVTQHRRLLGGGYLLLGVVLLGVGVGLLVSWS